MKVEGVSWVGVRTPRFDEMVRTFRDVMGLAEEISENGFVVLRTSGGDVVELFGPASEYNQHFGSAPVAGFAVSDFATALDELRAAGIEVVHVHADPTGGNWAHFRAPDGNLYEITG